MMGWGKIKVEEEKRACEREEWIATYLECEKAKKKKVGCSDTGKMGKAKLRWETLMGVAGVWVWVLVLIKGCVCV